MSQCLMLISTRTYILFYNAWLYMHIVFNHLQYLAATFNEHYFCFILWGVSSYIDTHCTSLIPIRKSIYYNCHCVNFHGDRQINSKPCRNKLPWYIMSLSWYCIIMARIAREMKELVLPSCFLNTLSLNDSLNAFPVSIIFYLGIYSKYCFIS